MIGSAAGPPSLPPSLTDALVVAGTPRAPAQIVSALSRFVSPDRLQRIQLAVGRRTFAVLPVLEELFDLGNVSAVLRSTEGLGIGAAAVVSSGNQFKEANRVSQGAEKWLEIDQFAGIEPAVMGLRERGYRIMCTHVGADATEISRVDTDQPVAVIFGNEHDGASVAARDLADGHCRIEMRGFVESFNVSVAAALVLHTLRTAIELPPDAGQLEIVEAAYLRRSIRSAEEILEAHFSG